MNTVIADNRLIEPSVTFNESWGVWEGTIPRRPEVFVVAETEEEARCLVFAEIGGISVTIAKSA